MKYLISNQYGCVYWLVDGELWVAPLSKSDSFDTDEGGLVERPHNEVPEWYYNLVTKVLKELNK